VNELGLFFAGALLCNAIPHLAAGVRGEPFPSPFAKPPGKGDSSPLVNVLWGSLNLLIAVVLLSHCPFITGFNLDFAVLCVGFLVSGIFLAIHFGKVRRGK
jgi:hypothetical protein